MPNSRTDKATPYELFHRRKPDLSNLIQFGQEAHVFDYRSAQSKFSPKTIEPYVIGYGDRYNFYRCIAPDGDKVVITSDVMVASH